MHFWVVLMAAVLLLASGCKAKDEDRELVRGPVPASAAVSEKAVALAVLSDRMPLADGHEIVFGERGGGVAYVANEGGRSRVVHNGRVGDAYEAVRAIAVSPEGRRVAHAALVEGGWRMVVDGTEGRSFDAIDSPIFSPDGKHLAYQAKAGDKWHVVVDGKMHRGTRTRLLMHDFSADSSKILFVDDVRDDGSGRLVVSDLAFDNLTVVDDAVMSAILSADKSTAAAITRTQGRYGTLTFRLDAPGRVKRGPVYDRVYGLALNASGGSMAYVAERAGVRYVVLDDREEPLPADNDMVEPPVVRPDKAGIGAVVLIDGAVLVRQFFAEAHAGARYDGVEGLVFANDGRSHAYAAQKGQAWVVVSNGSEGPSFDRVVSPSFSPDGSYLAYRARKDGKRFVVVADVNGRTLRRHPSYEQVFPARFSADGKSIAYGVKDGSRLAWMVEQL